MSTDAGKHGNAPCRDFALVRPMRATDRGRIAGDYVNSLRRNGVSDSWPRRLEWHEYAKVANRILDACFEHGNVLVACDRAAEDHVLGWLVSEPGTLHYAFTVERYRRTGVFGLLYEAAGLGKGAVITHLTYPARAMQRRYGWKYEPIYTLGER